MTIIAIIAIAAINSYNSHHSYNSLTNQLTLLPLLPLLRLPPRLPLSTRQETQTQSQFVVTTKENIWSRTLRTVGKRKRKRARSSH